MQCRALLPGGQPTGGPPPNLTHGSLISERLTFSKQLQKRNLHGMERVV